MRLEKELFELSVDSIASSIPYLENKYSHFYELFNYVIKIGETRSPYYPRYLKSFITDRTNREVYLATNREFPDIDMLEKALTEAFKHYKHYFSEKTIPDIYTFISGFNASIIIDTNILAIGLDRYLGTECEYYDHLGFYEYQQANMYKEKIVTDCMFAWVSFKIFIALITNLKFFLGACLPTLIITNSSRGIPNFLLNCSFDS